MSFNIRYNNPDDKANWWEYRKLEVVEICRRKNNLWLSDHLPVMIQAE